MRDRLRAAWQRFLHDETGAVCVSCGLEVVDGVLRVHVKPGGGLACSDTDGLSVDFPAVLDPISPDACNGIARRGNGLYSPCPDSISGIRNDASPQNPGLPLAVVGPNDTYAFDGVDVTMTNTLCCEVAGRVTISEGGLFMDNLVHNFLAIAHLELSINGGAFGPVTPPTDKRVHNNHDVNVLNCDFNNLHEQNWVVLSAGASITYKPRLVLTFIGAAASAGTVQGGLDFEVQWDFQQTGCC